MSNYFIPEWPAPRAVRAVVTTRQGGVSHAPYNSNNLALHVGDDPRHVTRNRAALCAELGVSPLWMNQTHSTCIWESDQQPPPAFADACVASLPQKDCCVLTADCLPLLICSQAGDQVAAVHAGWRGLAAGVISDTVSRFSAPAEQLMVYLGPAISQAHFEVGSDVFHSFNNAAKIRKFAEPIARSFAPGVARDKYFADLYRLARSELRGLGVSSIYGGKPCTFSDNKRFFSFRRDGETGRMASLVWIEPLEQ